jgi:hypothetical protein
MGVLQDALEQHRQFRRWPRCVFFGEFHHRVLDDVQRELLVAHRKKHLLECATLDGREKVRQFLARSQ